MCDIQNDSDDANAHVYTYDKLYQLNNVDYNDGVSKTSYSYDVLGNRVDGNPRSKSCIDKDVGMNSLFTKIDKVVGKEDWVKARPLIKKAIKKYPDDFYLLTQLAVTYYEQKNYEQAFEAIKKAYELEPTEPLVMWHYAGTLDMLGDKPKAIDVFKRIVKKGPEKIAYIDTTEGLRRAKSLINDCNYLIGMCYKDIGKKSLAYKWLTNHLENS